MDAFVMFLAIVTIVMGFIQVAGYILKPKAKSDGKDSGGVVALALGILVILLGIWVLFRPEFILESISVVFAIVLLVHGIRALREAFVMKKAQYAYWWIAALLAVVSIVLGIICVVNRLAMWNMAVVIIGIALIYNGLSNLWIISRAAKTEKYVRQMKEAIDVEVHDVED
jgi:uncharacterized membrane protein HdeD (DUF308 family)